MGALSFVLLASMGMLQGWTFDCSTLFFIYGILWYIMEKKYKEIIEAIKKDDVKRLNNLIASKADVCYNSAIDYFPIRTAVANNSVEALRVLLSYESDLNEYDENGESFISYAIYYNKIKILKLLVELGIDINICDRDSYWLDGKENFVTCSSIKRAIEDRNYRIASFLLKKGVKTNLKTDDEIKLCIALDKNNIELIKKLINDGVNIDMQDDSGYTPLMHAVIFIEDIELINWLLEKGASFHLKDNDNLTLLSLIIDGLNVQEIEQAEKQYYEEVLQIFINRGADFQMLQHRDLHPSGLLSIMDLSDKKKLAIIDKITKNDYEKSLMINSTLINAMYDYNIKSFEYFIQQKDIINFQDENGYTVLMIAIFEDKYYLLPSLLDKNPDINLQDKKGNTALMHAIKTGSTRTIELLLDKNPDLSIVNNDFDTAVDMVEYPSEFFGSHEWYLKYLDDNKFPFFRNLFWKFRYFTTTLLFKATIIIFVLSFIIINKIIHGLPGFDVFYILLYFGLPLLYVLLVIYKDTVSKWNFSGYIAKRKKEVRKNKFTP